MKTCLLYGFILFYFSIWFPPPPSPQKISFIKWEEKVLFCALYVLENKRGTVIWIIIMSKYLIL